MRALCLVVGLAIGLPSAALAQQPSERVRARDLFREGLAAIDEGRFAEAAEVLARSLAIRESAPGRYNRALALRGAGRYRAAIEEVDRFIELATGARHARNRAAALEMRDELRASLAHLRLVITGAPDAAELDGEALTPPEGTHELELDPGSHRVTTRRDGHAPVEREIELTAGSREELSLDASAAPLPARLRVDVDPANASILLDGELVGRGSVDVETAVGAHVLELTADGHLTERRELTLEPGDVSQLSIALRAEPSAEIYEEWWFWLIAGLGLAAGAAVLAVGIVIANDVPPIQTGTFGFAQEVLVLRF